MRIAFFTSCISPSAGGIQNTGYHFAREFNKHCEFDSFCAAAGADSEDLKNVFVSGKANGILQHVDLVKALFRAHRKNKYDFCFASLYPFSLGPYFLKKIKGIPYGVMVHGNELMENSQKSAKGSIKCRIRFVLLKNADAIFANSEYTKQLCYNMVPHKNITVIHPPIQYEHKPELKQETSYILFSVGRLVERKGFQYVIKAMPRILEEYPQVQYYIAGKGEYKNKLVDLITEMGLGESVHLLGPINEEEKDRWFSRCDYFIMPSYVMEEENSVEGFGIVYLEANMYGKFVIATSEGGASEAVLDGKTGVYVKPCNPDDIAEKVISLYRGKYSYTPQNCREWARKGSVENIVEQYLETISRILK